MWTDSAQPPFDVRPVPSPPRDMEIDGVDWRAFASTPVNVLMIGQASTTMRILTVAWPKLRKPTSWSDGSRLSFPTQSGGTFILQRAHMLSSSDQQELLDWLGQPDNSTRLVALTPGALFPLVQSGEFLDELYYRMNAVVLAIG